MAERLVELARGTTWTGLRDLDQEPIRNQFSEGEESVLRIDLRWGVAAQLLTDGLDQLKQHGFAEDWNAAVDGSTVTIRARYTFPPIWALAAAIFGVLLLAALIGWVFSRVVQITDAAIGSTATKLLVLGGVALVALVVLESG